MFVMNQQKWGERQRKAEMTNKRPTDAKKKRKKDDLSKKQKSFSLFCRKKIFCNNTMGSGCGAVGRAVASDNRDLLFKSQH